MTTQGSWAHPELLADTAWVAEHLDDPQVRVVDCDMLPSYQRLHIPNAVWAGSHYWKGDGANDSGLYGIDDPEQFAKMIGRLGVDNDTTIVAYDGSGGVYAARFWWTLDRFGHTNVQVLDGGLDKWYAEGRPLSRDNVRAQARTFTAQPPHAETCVLIDEVVSRQGDDSHVFWDTRSDGEWLGKNARGTQRGGRIPGAVHLEWLNNLNQPVRTLKDPDALRATLTGLGITPEKTVTTY
ncbi:MAG TPA: rhodanese-like domain-containing protein [Dehalococcoidia bacterium]|nr:rhodanese-like domain-containing protein [Dehalococcoidia bacterium]